MRKKLCIFLSSLMIFFNICYPVYADIPPTYQKTKEYLWQIMKDIGYIGTLPFTGIVELVNMVIHSKGISGEDDVTTEEEALDYMFDGISINGDGNVVLNDNAKLNINYLIDNICLDEQAYIYSYDGGSSAQYFSSAVFYVRLMDFLRQYQDEYYCLCVLRNDSKGQIWCINKERYPYLCMVDENVFRYPNMIKCMPVDGLTAQRVYDADMYFTWDSSDNTFKTAENKAMDYIPYLTLDPNQGFNLSTSSTAWTRGCIMTTGGVVPFRHFKTLSDITAQSVLYQPYYFNNSVYSNFESSTGDFVITNDNKNTVTYGDITSYIDSFNTENGYPPNPSQIEIHIHNESNPISPTPTPNPDNPSGGGSGGQGGSATASANNEGINININNNHNINVGIPSLSGNTVSGNGSGSSGGIFDWISDIGGVIGDFIKNVGQLIADVIKGITETITTVLADIPNIISALVEFVYGGLPDELKAIVTLGITTVIFVGVIKMMRK